VALDFFVAGRWRNREGIVGVLNLLDQAGFSSYCFLRNQYAGAHSEFGDSRHPNDLAAEMEAVALDDPRIKAIFDADLAAQRAAQRFLIVLPAGAAAHIEAGLAYGFGKPCYAVGPVEKTETLYKIFDRMFVDGNGLAQWLKDGAVSR
jgi:hypothetical protein